MKAATRVSRLIQEQGGKRHHDEYERLRIKVAAEEGYRTFSTCHYRDLGDPKEIEVAVATGLQGVADDRIGGDVEMVESGTSPYFRVPAGCVATWPGGGGTSADPGEISRRIEAEEVEASPEMLSAAKSAGWALAGPVVVFGPQGSTFSGPGVTVRLPLQNAGALMEERRAGLKVRVGAMKWHPAEGAGGEWREVAGAREDLEEGVVEVQADGFCAFTTYRRDRMFLFQRNIVLTDGIRQVDDELKVLQRGGLGGGESAARQAELETSRAELETRRKRLEEDRAKHQKELDLLEEEYKQLNETWSLWPQYPINYKYTSPGGDSLPPFGSPQGQAMCNGEVAEPDSRHTMSQSDQRQGDASGQTAGRAGSVHSPVSSPGGDGEGDRREHYTAEEDASFQEFFLEEQGLEGDKNYKRSAEYKSRKHRLMKKLPNRSNVDAVWRAYLRCRRKKLEAARGGDGGAASTQSQSHAEQATSEDRQSLSRSSSDDPFRALIDGGATHRNELEDGGSF